MNDTLIRYLEAGYDDPDRQLALRVTNFLAGMPAKRAVAIYSLAMSMSLRDCSPDFQSAALIGINEACLLTWEQGRGEPEGVPCGRCQGAGTIGTVIGPEGRFAPEDQKICPICKGTGRRAP